MSINIGGYAPVYTPVHTPVHNATEPKPDHGKSADAQAALNEALAAARRALEAARAAQAALEKAREAAKKNEDAAKTASLKKDVEAKEAAAGRLWADAKVAAKEALAEGGTEAGGKTAGQLKAMAAKDEGWSGLVDAAAKERPDIAIAASGQAGTDAAARRVSSAFASGGEAAAVQQLRTELQAAGNGEQRSAILRAAMPVVDRVAKALGTESRSTDGDWVAKAEAPCSPDPDSPNPIDTRGEYDHALADLEASVELAGDKEAAFHIAHDLLQVMPGGDRANSANNLLGLLGLDLDQSSAGNTSMLETAMAAALVQPDAKGQKGSVLAMPLAQRDEAARLLAPDSPVQLTIRDWTDEQGVKHDGTLWHEVEQNPDLLLTDQQRTELDQRTKGWTAAEALNEKSKLAMENLRQQNPDKDLDKAQRGDSFTYRLQDARKDLPQPLAPRVQDEVTRSKSGHQDDLQYGVDLDALTHTKAFRQLDTNQQEAAIGQFDRAISQAAKGGQPLEAKQKDQLRELIGSSSFHDVNSRVQDRVLGLFSELAMNGPGHLDGLKRLVDHAGFRALDSEANEFKVLDAYQHDGVYRGVVDKLTARTDLSPTDSRTALDRLTQVQSGLLYRRSDDGKQQQILDAACQTVTDPRFRGLARNQQDKAMDSLMLAHDLLVVPDDGGVDQALKAAAAVKPKEAASPPPAGSGKQASTTYGPQTPQGELGKFEAKAHEVATSDKTINDPLRRIAGDDPVTYAYLKVQAEHKDEKVFLKLLDETLPQHRRDYTTGQVKALVGTGDADKAMKLLDHQLDATKDPAERQKLWQAAGEPVFSRSWFDQQIDQKLEGQGLKLDALGELFSEVGENAPPEAANLMLDAIKARTDQGPDNPLWRFLVNDVSDNAETYEGLSLLVERADSLGANRADEFADFYAKAFDQVSRDRTLSPFTTLMLEGGVEHGLHNKITSSIAEHGAAKLSVALCNAARKHADGPENGNGSDWTRTIEDKTRNSIRSGIKEFRENLSDDVTRWQEDNKNALRLVQDYGNLDPEGVARAITRDRLENPDTYYRMEEDGPAGVDPSYAQVEQRGVQLDGLMRDLNGLGINFDKPSVPDEKRLGEEIQGLDQDPVALSTLQNNQTLDGHRASQINFGHFAPANSPWNPAAVVGSQRDHVDKLVRDYHLPDKLADQLHERTDQWETALRDELGKDAKVSSDKLQRLTDDYQTDLKTLLDGKLPRGGEGVLVKPSSQVVDEIRTNVKTFGTITSTLRLTMNWYRDSGDSLLRIYNQVAFHRSLDGKRFDPDKELLKNAARLGLSDEKTVDKSIKFMEKMQAEVDARTPAGASKPSAADAKALMDEFKRQAPQFGPAQPFDPKALPDAMKTSERLTRGLGMVCFFGSSLNNAINASNEKGVTSSDAFAALFGTGVVIEAYRSGRGLEMQGGKLQEGLQKAGMGPNGAEQLSKVFKSNALGSLVGLADLAWAVEDFTGYTVLRNKTTGEGDMTAGLLTSGVVAGDLVEIAAAGWRARATTMLAAEGATLAGAGWAPIVGWVAAGVQAVFLGARFAYGVTKDKNKFEFADNPDYAAMVKSLGFTGDQARELMNQSGGNTDVKVQDWEWLVPGWNSWQSLHALFGLGESFFQEGAMGPMHVLNPLFDANDVPQEQRLQYLQSLSPGEMKELVAQTHKILDDDMDDDGKIPGASTEGLESWMREHQLWKAAYLGA
ncbi:hypothetical protein [Ideonella sp. YS5]|uniref:hypothetical protein n=1 Tax=Ideonella sp. YS5 TaxID=3453714 RepID=UPI003EEDC682